MPDASTTTQPSRKRRYNHDRPSPVTTSDDHTPRRESETPSFDFSNILSRSSLDLDSAPLRNKDSNPRKRQRTGSEAAFEPHAMNVQGHELDQGQRTASPKQVPSTKRDGDASAATHAGLSTGIAVAALQLPVVKILLQLPSLLQSIDAAAVDTSSHRPSADSEHGTVIIQPPVGIAHSSQQAPSRASAPSRRKSRVLQKRTLASVIRETQDNVKLLPPVSEVELGRFLRTQLSFADERTSAQPQRGDPLDEISAGTTVPPDENQDDITPDRPFSDHYEQDFPSSIRKIEKYQADSDQQIRDGKRRQSKIALRSDGTEKRRPRAPPTDDEVEYYWGMGVQFNPLRVSELATKCNALDLQLYGDLKYKLGQGVRNRAMIRKYMRDSEDIRGARMYAAWMARKKLRPQKATSIKEMLWLRYTGGAGPLNSDPRQPDPRRPRVAPKSRPRVASAQDVSASSLVDVQHMGYPVRLQSFDVEQVPSLPAPGHHISRSGPVAAPTTETSLGHGLVPQASNIQAQFQDHGHPHGQQCHQSNPEDFAWPEDNDLFDTSGQQQLSSHGAQSRQTHRNSATSYPPTIGISARQRQAGLRDQYHPFQVSIGAPYAQNEVVAAHGPSSRNHFEVSRDTANESVSMPLQSGLALPASSQSYLALSPDLDERAVLTAYHSNVFTKEEQVIQHWAVQNWNPAWNTLVEERVWPRICSDYSNYAFLMHTGVVQTAAQMFSLQQTQEQSAAEGGLSDEVIISIATAWVQCRMLTFR